MQSNTNMNTILTMTIIVALVVQFIIVSNNKTSVNFVPATPPEYPTKPTKLPISYPTEPSINPPTISRGYLPRRIVYPNRRILVPQQIGVLYDPNNNGKIYKLFGKRARYRSNLFNYFVHVDTNQDPTIIPLKEDGRDNYDMKELYDGDTISIKELGSGNYTISLYERNVPF